MDDPTYWSGCRVETASRRTCGDDELIPGAPWPICYRHAAQLYEFMRKAVDRGQPDDIVHRALDVISGERALAEQHAREDARPPRSGLVYYLQLGDLVKIGYSARLRERLKTYPPHRRLLAVEVGDYHLEVARHGEFRAALRSGREWFALTSDLLSHINDLRIAADAPPILDAAVARAHARATPSG